METSSIHKSIFAFCLIFASIVCAQDRKDYVFGETRKLEFIVYILGEIDRPGEYNVYDDANIAELIAKAGGGTEFANLGSVLITRTEQIPINDQGVIKYKYKKTIIDTDVNAFLNDVHSPPLPKLQPGDIIFVKQNRWHSWRNTAAVIRDIAVIATAYFLYLRSTND